MSRQRALLDQNLNHENNKAFLYTLISIKNKLTSNGESQFKEIGD